MTPRGYLASLEFHGIKLGLDNIRHLMDAAGNPQRKYPTIHVAGTNGKGSVVAFAASILQSAGHRVGRFTSPHLLDVSERFLIYGEPIAGPDLDRHIGFFREASRSLANPPTYFEVCTAIALRHFAACKVDVAVIEVGMGGRFDSTNIVEPEVCAITNIALDHQKYLGDTIEAIAFEKAGIIKNGVPVVVGERTPAPLDVIESVAHEGKAPLLLKGRDFAYTSNVPARLDARKVSTHSAGNSGLHPSMSYRGRRFNLSDAQLGLAGLHQVENAAIAVALIETLHQRLPVAQDAVIRGLQDARWPCRLERVLDNPRVYIDVAHNPAGVRRLVESMPPCVVVFAASSDKDAGEMLHAMSPITRELILTRYDGPRAASLEQLSEAAGEIPHATCECLADAIVVGMRIAANDSPLLVVGSIFAAGQARQILMRDYNAPPPRF